MARFVFDTETNGLLPQLSKIHCLAIKDIDTGEVLSFVDHKQSTKYLDITDGLRILSEATQIVAHNGIEFDVPAIKKVYPTWDFKGELIDTQTICRSVFSNIKDRDFKEFRRNKWPAHLLMKPHTLEAWGLRLGHHKAKYDGGWENWSQEMHDYMIQDVAVLDKLLGHILTVRSLTDLDVQTELGVADWLQRQKVNGFPFDTQAAVKLYTEVLLPRRRELEVPMIEKFGSWYQAKGEVKTQGRTTRYTREHLPEGVKETFFAGAQYTPVERIVFNPSSRQHIAHVLKRNYGWIPEEFTESGEPQVNDDIIGALPYDVAPLITEYLLVDKRTGALAEGKQAWLKLVTPEGKIHGSVNQTGAATHRASHSSPNVSQVPASNSPYGKECRSLFTVPKGWKIVGADASGCQLRCLAHYMARYDGGAYAKVLIEGDVHTTNWEAGKPFLTSRGVAKTFIYAFLFGAGNWKIGHTCRPLASAEEKSSLGSRLKDKFLRSLPALDKLVKAVLHAFTTKKSVRLPSGHVVHIKSKHTALNYLLQGTEAAICKRWIYHANRWLKASSWKSGWDGDYAALVWSHDEIQVAVRDDERGLPKQMGEMLVSLFPIVEKELKFRCPLAGEYKIGDTWHDTH